MPQEPYGPSRGIRGATVIITGCGTHAVGGFCLVGALLLLPGASPGTAAPSIASIRRIPCSSFDLRLCVLEAFRPRFVGALEVLPAPCMLGIWGGTRPNTSHEEAPKHGKLFVVRVADEYLFVEVSWWINGIHCSCPSSDQSAKFWVTELE